uniref:Non-specific serine/threonine protein kinase n=1 Tax=Chromera velia CCMP2878 TaxID=1169474 RepID=A0A0G4HLN4_9ALVE|eukprot:Cvel_7393.t1-p1 / transcript=Cvel_7393.t1 / gene=Cvel_7393 / organism=Chromera_velia_CCMP2878 / gene_product=Probable serine/threonine-protein kinase fhkE, putative / transcript_product=Probable serine/threonine-protein kinase fhkE, putative / location=Cvel_scaffold385:41456-51576(+) / protein_length=729 / sequence_SO=supercontig / SO=protein_coding / is_pseudo=false
MNHHGGGFSSSAAEKEEKPEISQTILGDMEEGVSQADLDGESQNATPDYRARLESLAPGVPSGYFSNVPKTFEAINIGRAATCDVRVDIDKRISSVHFVVHQRQGHYFIVDSSANGTFLNNRRLKRHIERELSHDDVISLVVNPEKETETNRVFAKWRFKMPDEDPVEKKFHTMYKLGQRLGRGTFAEVFSATRMDDGLWVAVKVMERSIFERWRHSQNSTLSVDDEIKVLRSVQHRNCVALLDSFLGEKRLFLVFEMCSGGDLLEYILDNQTGGPIPEAEARVYFKMIVDGLHYLHERRIVHRDLKPENILLTEQGPNKILKITDFGLARTINNPMGGAHTFCGTPLYFAPELIAMNNPETPGAAALQAETGNRYGLAVDMWSLGVVLYIMLSAEPPFPDDRSFNHLVLTTPVSFGGPKWLHVSGQAKELIRKLLKVNPAERLTVEQVLHHPWLAASLGVTTDTACVMGQTAGSSGGVRRPPYYEGGGGRGNASGPLCHQMRPAKKRVCPEMLNSTGEGGHQGRPGVSGGGFVGVGMGMGEPSQSYSGGGQSVYSSGGGGGGVSFGLANGGGGDSPVGISWAQTGGHSMGGLSAVAGPIGSGGLMESEAAYRRKPGGGGGGFSQGGQGGGWVGASLSGPLPQTGRGAGFLNFGGSLVGGDGVMPSERLVQEQQQVHGNGGNINGAPSMPVPSQTISSVSMHSNVSADGGSALHHHLPAESGDVDMTDV